MEDNRDAIYSYQPLWGTWLVDELIGSGSFGRVYRIYHQDYGHTYTSVVKIITIPGAESARKTIKEPDAEQTRNTIIEPDTDKHTIHGYYQDMVHDLVNEVNILYSLSGNSNILGYHDHIIIEHKDRIGWDILIRMEYAKPLSILLSERQMSMGDILALGIDLCQALEICHKKGIIHRDIKDENIYISDDGLYKLGDFGIAMKLSRGGWTASMHGTPHYMAPEIYKGENYGLAVDIYSLGIVLYRLLNHGRLPHLTAYPEAISTDANKTALERRMNGEPFHDPDQAGTALSRVIMKACSYLASSRYPTATLLKKDLEKTRSRLSAADQMACVTMISPVIATKDPPHLSAMSLPLLNNKQ